MQELLGNLLLIPTLVVAVLLFGAVIRRLLGVRVGVVRTVLSAVLAVLLTAHLLQAVVPRPVPADLDAGTGLLLFFLTVCCACLLAMIVLVVAEVIIPDGSLPGPVELVHGWRSRLARTRRYSQIVGIAVRHGLGRFLRGRRPAGVDTSSSRRLLARSLRRALDEGGVTFVKLGQQLSTRRDLVPREFVEELTRLQDEAAPVPWREVEAVLAAELDRPVRETFVEIDPEPLAAASVAQVHAARLVDGTEVVVKVQRPGVVRIVERDLDILLRLARTLEARTLWGRTMGLRTLAAGFAEALREELDFTVECDNLRAVAAALAVAGQPGVRVPTPVSSLCTSRILVMDRLAGVPLGQAGDLLAGLTGQRRREMAGALLGTMFDQVLNRGLFHVDVHPGNVLVAPDGSVGLLDFGSVGRLDGTTRRALGRLLAALGDADSLTAADALLELVDRPEEIDERELERALGALIVRYAAPGATPGTAAFAALMRLITTHRLGVPPQVAAVFRAFATLEGTLTLIDPAFDLVAEARRAGTGRITAALSPPRLRQSMEEELAALLPLLRRLPRRVDRIADAVEHGRLTVNVRLLADRRDRSVLTGLLHQMLLTVLGSAAGLMAVLLLDNRGGPRITGSVELFAVLGYGMFIVAVVLVLRVLIVIFRPGPD